MSPVSMPGANLLKLNLGCGQNQKAGYINVDKFGSPDVLLDLESFPWPWETNSVDEIVLHHVMEHLGASAEVYFKIMQEMYRVCKPGTLIHITVPHPRHNHFAFDPTHVRGILPEGFMLFSKRLNQQWKEDGVATSPLGFYLDVDFELVNTQYKLDSYWQKMHPDPSQEMPLDLLLAIKHYYNVVEEITMVLEVVKNFS